MFMCYKDFMNILQTIIYYEILLNIFDIIIREVFIRIVYVISRNLID